MGNNKIGIFAGVFDPIHLGHTDFIARSIEENGLDKVYLLIEQEPKYKKCLAEYRHRKKMVELATSKIEQAEIYETDSKFFPITSSLPEIKKANPDSQIFLMLGDDVASHLKDWQDSEVLLNETELIIANRADNKPYSRASSLKVRNQLKDGITDPEISPEVLGYIRQNQLY